MFQRETIPFRRRCLAASVAAALGVTLGACSTLPRDDGLGGSAASAGRSTLEAGARVWERTMYLLGFGEEAAAAARDASDASGEGGAHPLLDEVDLAMLEEDAVLPAPDAVDVVRSSAWSDIAAASDAVTDERSGETSLAAAPVSVEPSDDEPAIGAASSVATRDLIYEIGPTETLWDIAKATTGDATNWHVLADVNDLAPDAAVYPGQELVIPADMVRPELAGRVTATEAATDAALPSDADALAAIEPPSAVDEPAVSGGVPDALEETSAERAGASAELRLDAGETLWDFAKRTTGDATNWRAIADANGFSEERATKVYAGQRIAVPTVLLRDSLAATDTRESTDAADAMPAPGPTETAGAPGAAESLETANATDAARASGSKEALDVTDSLAATDTPDAPDAPDAPIGSATLAESAESAEALGATDESAVASVSADAERDAPAPIEEAADDDTLGDSAPIRIVEAAYRTEPESGVTEAAAADALPAAIMVSGTYYPKAVYNDADFSSSLLMRVSPGTTLQVSRAVGPWYEVTTDQGTGYVHARDIK